MIGQRGLVLLEPVVQLTALQVPGGDATYAGHKSDDGGSNHTFYDGSVRFLKFGRAFKPINLWAVVSDVRNGVVPP